VRVGAIAPQPIDECIASLVRIRIWQHNLVENADPITIALADNRAHGFDVEVERPEQGQLWVVAQLLDVLVAVEGVIDTASGEILEASLKLLAVSRSSSSWVALLSSSGDTLPPSSVVN